jgi:hypothetical protein
VSRINFLIFFYKSSVFSDKYSPILGIPGSGGYLCWDQAACVLMNMKKGSALGLLIMCCSKEHYTNIFSNRRGF